MITSQSQDYFQPPVKRKYLLQDYQILQTLGKGTFSSVRKAVHIFTQQAVAIKILQKQFMTDPKDIVRLNRELIILRKVRHPNILQLFEILQDPNHYFIITELAEGGELFDYIVARGKLSSQAASCFFQQTIHALIYLHTLKISHRDLKPQNLMLDSRYNVKLIDFGLSYLYKQGQLLKTSCGSPCYAPPQMIDGKEYCGQKSDIWSLGVVLYAMLCGHLPFEQAQNSNLFQKIKKAQYSIPDYVDQSGKQLIRFILNTDPEKRPTFMDILNHSFCKPKLVIIRGWLSQYSPIHHKVIVRLRQQYKIEGIEQLVKRNKHNRLTAFYNLQLRKQLESDGVSIFQYYRENQQQIIEPKIKRVLSLSLNSQRNRSVSLKEVQIKKYIHLFSKRQSPSFLVKRKSKTPAKTQKKQILQKVMQKNDVLKKLNIPESFMSNKIRQVLSVRLSKELK